MRVFPKSYWQIITVHQHSGVLFCCLLAGQLWVVTFFVRCLQSCFLFKSTFLGFFFKHTAFVMFVKISCFISCFHAFVFCQARSASPLKSIMLGFFGSIEVTSFPWEDTFFDWCFSVLLYEKKIQSICFWISLVQKELKTIMVELFRYNFCFSLCLLNFWLYAIFLNFVTVLWSYLVWFAVFWLGSAILCLLIWLCIHFSPKSVLWQFSIVMVCTSLEFS